MPDQHERLPRILFVEDDRRLVDVVTEYLALNRLSVGSVGDGAHALAEVARSRPDLIVLDVMLPGLDGFEVAREIRAAGHRMPVLMLTARDEDADRVIGLEFGADDYLVKPVQPRVLLAHIKAALRRGQYGPSESQRNGILEFGRLRINGKARGATFDGEPVHLSAAEFDLLWLLASSAGKVLGREELLLALRGLRYDHQDRSVDSRVFRLRKRFAAATHVDDRIKSVRPHGYLFSTEPW